MDDLFPSPGNGPGPRPLSRRDTPGPGEAADAAEGVVRFIRPPALPGVEVMTGERSPHLWRVYHETYTVCFVPPERNPRGFHVDWRYRGRSLTHPAGGALLMEPGEVHVTRRLSGPASFWVLQIDPRTVEEAARALGLRAPPHLALQFAELPPLVGALRRLYQAAAAEGRTALEQQSRLAAYLRRLLEHCSEDGRPRTAYLHPGVRRAREYLEEHFAEPVSLGELERVAHLSRFHLVRSFRARYGLPPHAFQVQLRLAAARKLIRDGVPLAQVAAEAGFADQSHLGRHFRRIWSVTPGAYSAAARRGS